MRQVLLRETLKKFPIWKTQVDDGMNGFKFSKNNSKYPL